MSNFGILLSSVQDITLIRSSPPIMGVLPIGLGFFWICGVVVCLFIMARSGVQWATAKKDKAKRARAKRRIIWSLVGLLAVFLTFFIIRVTIFVQLWVSKTSLFDTLKDCFIKLSSRACVFVTKRISKSKYHLSTCWLSFKIAFQVLQLPAHQLYGVWGFFSLLKEKIT